jgi:FixJ family two-component response regulator
MNGSEMRQRIRLLQPGIRVLRMSGYTDRLGDRIKDGAPFIQKPFTAEDLLKKIRELLDGSRNPAPIPINS